MFGKPQDVAGECNAHLYIGDDFGDNEGTMRCQLEPGHDGPHTEKYGTEPQQVLVTWTVDEKRAEEPEEFEEAV